MTANPKVVAFDRFLRTVETVTCGLSALIAVSVSGTCLAQAPKADAAQQPLRSTTEETALEAAGGSTAELINGLDGCFATATIANAICSRPDYDAAVTLACQENARSVQQQCLERVQASTEQNAARATIEPTPRAPQPTATLVDSQGGQTKPDSIAAADPGQITEPGPTQNILRTPDLPFALNLPRQRGSAVPWRDPPLDHIRSWPDSPRETSGPRAANSLPDVASETKAPVTPSERQFDPQQAGALFRRAEAMIANGDLPAARLILQRLTERKDARAAYLLGQTYDPVVLQQLGVMGIKPEPEKARSWYDQALNWGFQRPAEVPVPAVETKSDPQQATALFQRAEAMIANGDLPAARLILQRLAERKDARAAFLLARTYDPVVLQELGVLGIKPEPEKARSWYDHALNWGYAQQPYQQLHALDSTPATAAGKR